MEETFAEFRRTLMTQIPNYQNLARQTRTNLHAMHAARASLQPTQSLASLQPGPSFASLQPGPSFASPQRTQSLASVYQPAQSLASVEQPMQSLASIEEPAQSLASVEEQSAESVASVQPQTTTATSTTTFEPMDFEITPPNIEFQSNLKDYQSNLVINFLLFKVNRLKTMKSFSYIVKI